MNTDHLIIANIHALGGRGSAGYYNHACGAFSINFIGGCALGELPFPDDSLASLF